MHSDREKIALAIVQSYKSSGLDFSYADALGVAEYLLGFFGYGNEIIDNVLESYDRDVFYEMEDKGILKTENTVEKIDAGSYRYKEWRMNKWILNTARINVLARQHYGEWLNGNRNYVDLYESIFNNKTYKDLEGKSPAIKDGYFSNNSDFNAFNTYDGGVSLSYVEGEDSPLVWLNEVENGKTKYLSLIVKMLSPPIKPALYLSMENGIDYTSAGIERLISRRAGIPLSEVESHTNLDSILGSMASVGLISIKQSGEGSQKTYAKTSNSEVEAIMAKAIRAYYGFGINKIASIPEIFPPSMSEAQRITYVKNAFGLLGLLVNNKDSYSLKELRDLLGDGIRHIVNSFADRGIIYYDSYSSSGVKSKTPSYYVLKKTHIDDLVNGGFVARPQKCSRLSRVISFVNDNLGNFIERHAVSESSGADLDLSSKYLVMLSNAGVLMRDVEWNGLRSTAMANSSSMLVWEGMLSWIYEIAKYSGVAEYAFGNANPLDSISIAVKKAGLGLETSSYLKSESFANDSRSLLRDYFKENKIHKNDEFKDAVLKGAANGNSAYMLKNMLVNDYKISFTAAGWHVKQMLRKGLIEKVGNKEKATNKERDKN